MHSTIKHLASMLAKLPFPKNKLEVDKCKDILNEFHERPSGQCIRKNDIDIQYDLQIIVPAYNADKFIRECLNSILEQNTDYSYIVTVINDGSIDQTKDILENYQNNKKLEIIHQKNRGFSGARNRGLEILKGKYISFVDSDDRMAKNAIQNMLNMAIELNADIVQGGWYEFGDGHNEKKLPSINGEISNTQEYFSGYPWAKAYKYTVLENFQFPEGFWFEDTPISFMLEALPLKFAVVNEVVYEYRINPQGITQNAANSKKSVDSYWIMEQCLQEFPGFGLSYDQRAYDYFIRQTVTNHLRTRRMPCKVRKSIFLLTADCMEKFFGEIYTVTEKKYEGIEQALKIKNYFQYELYMIQFR